MRHRRLHAGCVLTILMGSGGCAAPRILGKATLVDESGAPLPPPPTPGVTLNFINLGGKIEESVVSVQTDVQGKYRSPELPPGRYAVEAARPGFVIGRATVVLGNHGTKEAPFGLKKSRDSKDKSPTAPRAETLPTP